MDSREADNMTGTGNRAVENGTKSNTQEELTRIPQLPASFISEKIESGEYSTKLSRQQFLQHVEGTIEYGRHLKNREERGLSPPSVLSISETEAQQLILRKCGKGMVGADKKGNPLSFESITADRIIDSTWSGNKYIETKKARIHYGKKTSHIVPIGGFNYD